MRLSADPAPTSSWRTIDSPLGPLLLEATDAGLTRVEFLDHVPPGALPPLVGQVSDPPSPGLEARQTLDRSAAQLSAYFSNTLTLFELPLAPHGSPLLHEAPHARGTGFPARDERSTPFQLEVWRALLAIPFGETRTYAQIARAIGRPDAVRAVGAANGANPIAIIIPCHRVIGADGSLTGYGGGMDRKRALLNLESAHGATLFAGAR